MATEVQNYASDAAIAAVKTLIGANPAPTDPDLFKQILCILGAGLSGNITVTVANGASFSIPAFDYQAFDYYGGTNNIQTQTFKSGGASGTTVATLTYTYVSGAVGNDDLIETITQN